MIDGLFKLKDQLPDKPTKQTRLRPVSQDLGGSEEKLEKKFKSNANFPSKSTNTNTLCTARSTMINELFKVKDQLPDEPAEKTSPRVPQDPEDSEGTPKKKTRSNPKGM